MRISKNKLDLVLARRCMALTDLRSHLAPNTLVKIRNGDDLRTKTVGRLAQLLECDPADIIENTAATVGNVSK